MANGRVIYETETPYQYARVVQLRSGERWLQLNEGLAIHSALRARQLPDRRLLGRLPRAAVRARRRRRRSASRSSANAAGTVARAYGHYFPQTRVDAVELDGKLTEIGKRYFDLRGPNLHLYTADARPWLAASQAHYDAIFLDAYRQPYIPFYLLTKEFFANVRAHLTPGGVMIVNVGHVPDSDALEKVVSATLARGIPEHHPRPGQPDQLARGGEHRTAVVACAAGGAATLRRELRYARAACGGADRAGAHGWKRLHRRPRAGRVADRLLDRPLRDGRRVSAPAVIEEVSPAPCWCGAR